MLLFLVFLFRVVFYGYCFCLFVCIDLLFCLITFQNFQNNSVKVHGSAVSDANFSYEFIGWLVSLLGIQHCWRVFSALAAKRSGILVSSSPRRSHCARYLRE
ncbi:hypothetical protein Y032_0350g3221 [Ancylostoma ceylanicum]|uniref:Uncharacterized protein n=1 Tax=Ancylostoma ceylanicum TaxID=53326 RepID=A0A016RWT4_9BILA|nr:hypothetical protein Y032_0350g3221 [Ancylostoma ceylanicum]